jgi:hypothetical protein
MEIKQFWLGNQAENKLLRILRIILGLICIVISIYWISFSLKNPIHSNSIWITILFLSGFGFYQIWSGAGKAARFIITGPDVVILKKNSLLPPRDISPVNIEKITFLPLSIEFIMKSKEKILIRFGTINYETNENIVDELISFAEFNNIRYEIKEEEI